MKGSNVAASPALCPEEESAKAIAAARRALDKNGSFLYGNVAKLENEFYNLNLFGKDERFAAVDIGLCEIKPKDRCGPDPPGDVSFPPYGGRRLYAFKWPSSQFRLVLYMKFCLAGVTGTELLVLYSFHEDRP